MSTQFSEVYDLFMTNVSDYRLTALFNQSSVDFENFLQAWLRYAINDFKICDQDLSFNTTGDGFKIVLKDENIIMLTILMVKWWLQKTVNDVTQMNLHVTDKDFKFSSEAQNLREKVSYLNIVKEQCSQALTEYSIHRVTWVNWYNQNFDPTGGV